MLSRSKIKYLTSLKIKKFRILNKQFILEGDKIVKDMLLNGTSAVAQLIASDGWLKDNQELLSSHIKEILEADALDLERITTLETPPAVMVVLDIPEIPFDHNQLSESLVIALDNIQDPGNLGTIIRTADWFGIQNVLCGNGCADIYNPKAVQSSMGAILHLNVHYSDLVVFLKQNADIPGYEIFGTFMKGTPVSECKPLKRGIIVFGNESRGISPEIVPFINQRITIPAGLPARIHVESLNVASAVAIVCAQLTRN